MRASAVVRAIAFVAGTLSSATLAVAACDPHYRSETCVPIAYDVDCWPGKGNGPEYVSGPFHYEGEDIYGLDTDHDGIACEPPPR